MTLPTLHFDDSFFEEETRWDYTISPEMKKVWAAELDMLQKLLDVCEKHNLKIYADGGTLLGAIRHSGYVPWDDDIDMVMLREDYDKLMEIGPTEFTEPYFFQNYKTDSWYGGFAKIRNSTTTAIYIKKEQGKTITYNQGIWIDVFPYDKVPDGNIALKLHELKLEFLIRCKHNYLRPKNELSFHAKILNAFITLSKKDTFSYNQKIHKLASKYKNKNKKRVAPSTFNQEKKYVKPISVYDSVKFVDFENIKIPVPGGYEKILTKQYGDYMKPIKGTALHGNYIFIPDTPYKEYRGENK